MPEDVDIYFENEDWVKDAVLTTASGSNDVKVLYFDEYEASEIAGIEAAGTSPEAHLRTSEDPGDIVHGTSTIVITGLNSGDPFLIKEKRIQGELLIILILSYN